MNWKFFLFITFVIQAIYSLGWLICHFGFADTSFTETRAGRAGMYFALWFFYPILWLATKCADV